MLLLLLLLVDIRIKVVVVVWRAARGRRVLMRNGQGKQASKATQGKTRPGEAMMRWRGGWGGVRWGGVA
jgi:hypothetical protein